MAKQWIGGMVAQLAKNSYRENPLSPRQDWKDASVWTFN